MVIPCKSFRACLHFKKYSFIMFTNFCAICIDNFLTQIAKLEHWLFSRLGERKIYFIILQILFFNIWTKTKTKRKLSTQITQHNFYCYAIWVKKCRCSNCTKISIRDKAVFLNFLKCKYSIRLFFRMPKIPQEFLPYCAALLHVYIQHPMFGDQQICSCSRECETHYSLI